jgi:hypothetical protein
LEADIHVLGERVKTVNTQADRFVDGDFSDVGGKITIQADETHNQESKSMFYSHMTDNSLILIYY